MSRRPGQRFSRRSPPTTAGAVQQPISAPVAGTSVSTIATSGTTRLVDLSPLGLVTGDRIYMRALSRVAGTNTMTVPAGQGWTLIAELNEASVSSALWVKTWGADGQTDALSVTVTTTVGGTWGVVATRIAGVSGTAQVTAYTVTPSNVTQTAPLVPLAVGNNTLTMWFNSTFDDNALNANTRGTLAYGGAGYNIGATGAVSLVTEQNVDSSLNACSVTESANGPDAGRALTLVLNGPLAPGADVTLAALAGYARSNINGTGWRASSNIHPVTIGGLLYEHTVFVAGSPVRSLTLSWRSSANGGVTWSAWTSYNSGSITDPVGTTNWPSDGHFTATINLTKAGNVQVFLLAHANESAMQFWLGTGGPTDIALDAIDLAVWTPPAAWIYAPASYPRLLSVPSDGTATLVVRDGVAGGVATIRVFEQTAVEGTWLDVTPVGLMFYVAADDESPYLDQCIFDSGDVLHCSWLWAKNSETDDFHDKLYCKGVRSGAGTYAWKDAANAALTLPFDQTFCIARTTGLNKGQNANNGIGLNSDNTPLLPYFLGDGADTRLWLTMYVGGVWVNRDLGIIATGWNLIGAPPASEYALTRTPTAWYRGGSLYVAWTCDQTVGPGGLPYVVAKSSSDNGVTWSNAYRLINEEVGNWCPRYDPTALIKHGLLHFAIQMTDEANHFGNPLTSPAFVVNVP